MAFEACSRGISSKGPFPGTCPGLPPHPLYALLYCLCGTCPILKLPGGSAWLCVNSGPLSGCLLVPAPSGLGVTVAPSYPRPQGRNASLLSLYSWP